jgi:hypothetical protein
MLPFVTALSVTVYWRTKVAPIVASASTVTASGLVVPLAPPVHPVKTYPAAGTAVSTYQTPTDVGETAVSQWVSVIGRPFEDGNGRIGRAIADLELARADSTSERFYSMSAQIESERKDYYLQLERGQRGSLDITLWLEWFLQCLGRAIEAAEQTLSGVLLKAKRWDQINREPVNERQRKILNRLIDGFEGKLTTSKYGKIAKCSEDTALRDIQSLIKRGILTQNEGGGRSTSYSLAEIEIIRP